MCIYIYPLFGNLTETVNILRNVYYLKITFEISIHWRFTFIIYIYIFLQYFYHIYFNIDFNINFKKIFIPCNKQKLSHKYISLD